MKEVAFSLYEGHAGWLDSVLYPPPDPRGSTIHVHTASWASMVRIPRAPRYPGALSCCMPSRRSIAGPSGQGVAAATVANSQCHHSGPPGTQHSDISTAQVREDALVFLWFESVTSLQSQSPTASALTLGPLAPSQRKTQEFSRKLHSNIGNAQACEGGPLKLWSKVQELTCSDTPHLWVRMAWEQPLHTL